MLSRAVLSSFWDVCLLNSISAKCFELFVNLSFWGTLFCVDFRRCGDCVDPHAVWTHGLGDEAFPEERDDKPPPPVADIDISIELLRRMAASDYTVPKGFAPAIRFRR